MENKSEITISYRTIMRVVGVGLLIYLIVYLKSLVLVFLTSLVIATFITEASRYLSRRGFNRKLAVCLIYLLSLAVIVLCFALLIPLIMDEVIRFLSFAQKYIPEGQFRDAISGANGFASGTQYIVSGHSSDQILGNLKSIFSTSATGVFATINKVFGGAVNIVLIFVMSFYLSMEENGIEKFLRIVVPSKSENYIISLWNRTERKIALWMKGQMFMALIVAIMTYVALLIIGVPYALLIALLTGVFELIPYGVTLAAIPAAIFAFLQGGLNMAFIALGVFVAIQQFEAYFIQPLVMKKVIGVSPLVIILSVLIGFQVAGFWGLILAIPFATFVQEYLSDVEQKKSEYRIPSEN